MEWLVLLQYADSDHFERCTYEERGPMVRHLVGRRGIYGYMINGARCYDDCGSLEYATGESDSFIETVASEIAGEQLVDEALSTYIEEREHITDFELLKRPQLMRVPTMSTDRTGYHINLCGDARTFEIGKQDLYNLALWASTASLYTGSGKLYKPDDESLTQFTIAQKSLYVDAGLHTSTTGRKPLISLRHEPLANSSQFNRVQVVGIDANVSPWASWMALGTASLSLRAIEQSVKGRDLHLREHEGIYRDEPLARLARAVARNPELDTVVELDDGTTIRAIDIQRELYMRAEQTDHTDEEALVLNNWHTVLNDVDGDRSFLKQKTGWMQRLELLDRYDDLSANNESQLLQYDRELDSVRQGSIANELRATLWKNDMPDPLLIKERRDSPCPTTRAALRGAFIQESIAASSIDYSGNRINWDSWTNGEGMVQVGDPLTATLPAKSLL